MSLIEPADPTRLRVIADLLLEHGAPGAAATVRASASQLEAMQAEIDRLRQIVSDCATALDSGAMIRPDATLDFMGYLPDEIRLRVQKLKASHSQESAK